MYKIFSEYGFSVKRPLIWLGGMSTVFGLAYGFLASESNCHSISSQVCQLNTEIWIQTIEFSLLQSLPPLNLTKISDVLTEVLFRKTLYPSFAIKQAVNLLTVIQKIAAISAWFLTALALRNMFRMK